MKSYKFFGNCKRLRDQSTKFTGSRGLSLVSVLMAAAILGLLLVAGARYFSNQMKSQVYLQQVSEKRELREFLVSTLDCTETITSSGVCPTEFRDRSGNSMPLQRGAWEIQLKCGDTASGKSLTATAAKLAKTDSGKCGKYAVDKLRSSGSQKVCLNHENPYSDLFHKDLKYDPNYSLCSSVLNPAAFSSSSTSCGEAGHPDFQYLLPNPNPKCCRVAHGRFAGGTGLVSFVDCNSDEKILFGQGRCFNIASYKDDPNYNKLFSLSMPIIQEVMHLNSVTKLHPSEFPSLWAEGGHLHTSGRRLNGYEADCVSSRNGYEFPAHAIAVCCKK